MLIIGEAEADDPNRLPLTTKRKSPIPNTRRRPQPPALMAAAVRLHIEGREGTRKLRSASSEYNCVGMLFSSRRAWIDTEHLRFILEEDDYKRIEPAAVQRGDVILYADGTGTTHVGLVWRHMPDVQNARWVTEVLSQWGSDGEYFHDAHDVPHFLGTPREFWTDRVDL